MTDRLNLPQRYRRILEALLHEHVPDAEVWAYGSRITGESHEGSDLDLVVRGPELKPLGDGFFQLLEALEKSNIPILIQAHDWARLPESFHGEIEREYVVLVGKDGWKIVTLRDLGTIITGKTPSTRRETNFGGHIPFVTPRDLDGVRMIYKTERYLTDAGAYTVKYAVIPANTVMVSCIGSDMGKAAIAGKRCVTNQQINSIIIDDKFDYKYIYYSLSTRKDELRDQAGGSAVPILNKGDFGDIEICLPPLSEQRTIAHIIGTLDDKIELNRRMNETLEKMARALFKSWFVDFDPVRAKAALINPPSEGSRWTEQRAHAYLDGMDKDIVDLFADRLVDSELGEIPEGWEVKALGDVADQRRSGVSPEQIDPGSPYIGLEHMPQHCIALSEWGSADGLASGKFRFKQGDILFGKLRPYFHKVGVAPLDGLCSTDIVVVSPISTQLFGYVLGHSSSKEFVDYTDVASTGTRMPRTKWEDMALYKVALPSVEQATAFNSFIRPWIKWMLSRIHESRALAAQRDELLPKLVSGNVRID